MQITLTDAQLEQFLPKLEDFGRWWFVEHNPTTPSAVLTKRGAFTEVMGRIYFQGRRDKMSFQVLDTVRRVLHALDWEVLEFDPWVGALSLDHLRQALSQEIGKGKFGRGRDIDLTVGFLSWVKNLPDHDISTYFAERLSEGRLVELYYELQGIPSVGPKIASFVLRDFVFGLTVAGKLQYPFRSVTEYVSVFPVDVHVTRAAPELGIPAESPEQVAEGVIRLCERYGRNPMLVAQAMFGLNYMGRQLSSAMDGPLP